MRINSFEYQNKEEGWNFEKIYFSELTLLVGVSGVGKTQILRAFLDLINIAIGNTTPAIKWQINFNTANDENYIWEGELNTASETKEDDFLIYEKIREKPNFIYEKLWLNGELLIDRIGDEIIYCGNKSPKIDISDSATKIIKEDNIINVFSAFKKMIFRDYTENDKSQRMFDAVDFDILKSKYSDINKIRESGSNILRKLALVEKIDYPVFEEIKNKFCDIFHQVEKIKVEKTANSLTPFFQVKLKIANAKKWVNQNRISSGMLRTLFHIAEMYLCEDGTVFLIDEFENSLGINCVNIISEDLIMENQRMQFIITSHHPYIINKIPWQYWKIVTRNGGTIKVHDATEFDLGTSHHENFIKLINLKEYRYGIEL